jgi:hypothetical protein
VAALFARMMVALGCALGLFALSVAHPAATACPILTEQTTVTPKFSVDGIETTHVWGRDEQIQSDTGDFISNPSDIAAVIEPVISEDFGPIGSLGLNDRNGSYRVSVQHGENHDGYALEHNVAISLYFDMYGANADVANDLLTSYHGMSGTSDDITTMLESAIGIDTIGPISTDSFIENHTSHEKNEKNTFHIVTWVQFFLSFEMAPYYVIMLSLFLIVKIVRMLVRRG